MVRTVELTLDVAGRPRVVNIRRAGGEILATVDGREFRVDARSVGADRVSLIVQEGDAAPRGVAASITSRRDAPGVDVWIGGHAIPVARTSRFARRAADGGSSVGPAAPLAGRARGAQPQHVKAPMPGRIVRVLVAPGDEVRARQGLVVVEAMKMENELRASREGRVREVRVVEGQSVDAGTLLVTVE
jgi:biotin carboxyl carrier protein